MTDNEIIKALECCSIAQDCTPCKYEPSEYEKGTIGCCNELMKNAIDLIKRQQAEMVELRVIAEKNNDKLNSVIDCQEAEIKQLQIALFKQEETIQLISKEKQEYFVKSLAVKSEAITEFAKRLKDMHNHNTTSVVSLVTVFDNINRLVKEMTEGDNGE